MYTSPADTEDCLSVSEGDSLHILSVDNPEWWYAVNDKTEETGFIPRSYLSENLRSYR